MDHYCSRFGQLADRKRAEVALVLAKENAEKAAEAAQDASRAKSEFLTNMSHEIRTPMNGVLGMTELLSQSELSDRQRKFVNTAHQSAETLLNIINDILDFSRIEAGKLDLDDADFDVRDTVENVVELLAESAQNKGVEIACLVSREVPRWVRGDPTRLRQIVFNLVGNGIKFTDSGEVVVRVGLDQRAEAFVALSFEISDTGIGIAPEAMRRIQEPFEQADGTITRKFGGTGLGLAIARQLIGLMGGNFEIESKPGKGSTFRFMVRLRPSLSEHNQESNRQFDLSDTKVLIIDDNATNREILHHYLAHSGAISEAAADGPRALQMLHDAVERNQPFDVALLDMLMPGMSGLEVAKAVETDPALAATRLIVLTSMGRYVDLEGSSHAQDMAFLTKPVRQSELLTQIGITVDAPCTEAVSQPQQDPLTRAPEGSEELSALDATVLVAEDNPVNQEVIVAYLATLGCRTDVVTTGVEVLSAVARSSYDLILMDCQMPDMDGLEATKQLRLQERQQHQPHRTPVIAVTANAFGGERERCLAAGMDDYVSKPFKHAELREILQHWLDLERSQGETGHALGDVAGALAEDHGSDLELEGGLLDEKALDDIRKLQKQGAPSLLDKIIKLYLETSPKLLETLHDTIAEDRSARSIREAAHGLKSCSVNLGATRLAALCGDIEEMARQDRTAGAEKILCEIERLYPEVCGRLAAELQDTPR
jgi:CheY-like chemotaxis protein/HPt (histidine-containing phosphotransfer) domain-containing protein